MKAIAFKDKTQKERTVFYESNKTINHRSNAGGHYFWRMGSDRDHVRG
jgi:hypothetical protein